MFVSQIHDVINSVCQENTRFQISGSVAKGSENIPKHYELKAFKLSCFGVCTFLIAELLN